MPGGTLDIWRLWWVRFWAVAVKELRVVFLDKRARVTLIASPILQLLLFGFASTLEVRNIDIGLVDRDSGRASEQIVAALQGSPNIRSITLYPDGDAMQQAIETRQIIGGISIDQRLSAQIASGKPGEVLVMLDGRRSNAAQIVGGYLSQIVGQAGVDLVDPTGRLRSQRGPPDLVVQHWFNPNLDYMWFTLPALIAVITVVLVMSISAQSVARERELGTMDQMIVLPLSGLQIMLGKLVPASVVGFGNATLFVVLLPTLYGIPLTGSVPLLYLALFFYIVAVVGLGLFVSVLAQSQQQAFLAAFMTSVPLIMLSGYASPVANMPQWLQYVTEINPTRHFLVIVEGVFLKDLPAADIGRHIWPIILTALFTTGTSALMVRAKVQ